MSKLDNPVLLFDGVCNLCVGSVQFFLRNDRRNVLMFASLQSEFGKKSIEQFQIPDNIDSLILIKNNRVYIMSSAALLAAAQLGGLWPLVLAFWIVPKFIRDYVYKIIAKNRYKWFGSKESCWLPTPELKKRFIDS